MSGLLWALLAVPLSTGALLVGAGRRVNALAPPVGVAVGVATLGLACATAALHPSASAPLFAGIRAGLRVDALSAVLVITVSAITLAVLLFSGGEFDQQDNRGRFFGCLLLFAGAMLITVTATNLALLLIGWEGMGALSYALIGFWWREPRRVSAATTAFLTTRAADLGLYLAAGAATAGGVRALSLAALSGAPAPWRTVLTAGMITAALGKSAQLPFSFWLSRAMEGPSPVSALLHSATMVAAGAYLLLRLHPLLAAVGWAQPTVAWVGALTALLLGLVAVAQTDLKQLLAASTSAQIGFMILAAGSGGLAGGVDQLVAHAVTKSLLFLAAGAWLTALGTKALPALRGAARSYRLIGITFTVGAASLAGFAPLSLWASKDALLAAVLNRSPALYALGLSAAVVSAVYSSKALVFLWQPVPVDAAAGYDRERRGTRRVAPAGRPALVILAVGAAVLGVLTVPVVFHQLARGLGTPGEVVPRLWELLLSAVLAVLAAALTWWWGDRSGPYLPVVTGWVCRWLDLERAAHALVVRPTLRLAGWLAWCDDHIIDGAVHQITRGALLVAGLAARVDDRGIDRTVYAVAAAARAGGRWARRPQTGQLYQYYAQVLAAFALLALLLVLAK